MTWFKVDDALHSHPKWLAASVAARALWVTAGSWCAQHLTDGHVPRHVLPRVGGRPRDATELVRIGLWEPYDDGWLFHNWADFQPSAASVEAERAAARERQQKARDRARESRSTSRRDVQGDIGVTNAVSHGPPRFGPPDPTRPITVLSSNRNLRGAVDNGTADQQQAARAAAQAHMQAVADLATEEPDPALNTDAIARIRAQHPLAHRPEDPA